MKRISITEFINTIFSRKTKVKTKSSIFDEIRQFSVTPTQLFHCSKPTLRQGWILRDKPMTNQLIPNIM